MLVSYLGWYRNAGMDSRPSSIFGQRLLHRRFYVRAVRGEEHALGYIETILAPMPITRNEDYAGVHEFYILCPMADLLSFMTFV
jgi:hypothetical protein